MPILIVCPRCKSKAQIAEGAAGKTVRCSGCRATFVVPQGTGELLVEWGPVGSGRRVPLAPQQIATIGRATDNVLCLPGPLVSRHHARLEWVESEWRLRDLSSGNGTFVNGHRAREIGLTDGCRIVIGDFALRLSLASTGPSDLDQAMDAMALEESRSGATAIVGPTDAGADPHADTAAGTVALVPSEAPDAPLPERRPPLLERWPVLAALAIVVVVIVVLVIRSLS